MLGEGDRSKCHEKITALNRSLANYGKQKYFLPRDKRRVKSAGHSILMNRPITAGGRNMVGSAQIKYVV
jgi:hypothetical protein